MPIVRIAAVLCGLSAVAGAQSVPAGWHAVKDSKSICQAAVPGDWKQTPVPAMMADSKQTLTELIVNEEYDSFKPMSPELLKMHGAEKVVENDAKRIFLVGKANTFLGKTTRSWSIWVPAAKGTCHMEISLTSGADEDLARKVADTLQPAK